MIFLNIYMIYILRLAFKSMVILRSNWYIVYVPTVKFDGLIRIELKGIGAVE
jgi:hypothetical protein